MDSYKDTLGIEFEEMSAKSRKIEGGYPRLLYTITLVY